MRRAALAVAVAAILVAGCNKRATEILIGVATDLSAQDMIDRVVLSANHDGIVEVLHQEWDISGRPSTPFELPGSFGIYTADGSEPRVEVRAIGMHGRKEILHRTSILTLVSQETLFLRLALVDRCVGNDCSPGYTCVEGTCRRSEINSRSLPRYRKGMELAVLCNSGTQFRNTSTKQLMPVAEGGNCGADEECVEGSCYKHDVYSSLDGGVTVDAGADAAAPDLGPAPSDLAGVDATPTLACGTPLADTVAGNGIAAWRDGSGGGSGGASFHDPAGVAVDAIGNIYVADAGNHRIRKIAPDGTTTTLAGNGLPTTMDGTGGATGTASFASPVALAIFGGANLLVVDGNAIRKVMSDGSTTTVSGNVGAGYVDDPAVGANVRFNNPGGIAFGGGFIWIADSGNNRIRQVFADSFGAATLSGNGGAGFFDGTGGATGTTLFNQPKGIAVDAMGILYVADLGNCRIRRVAADGSTTTLAGNGTCAFMDGAGGPNSTVQFNYPSGLVVSGTTVYVADAGNDRIRSVAPDGTTATVAGSGTQGWLDTTAMNARFYDPAAIAFDGALIVADQLNQRVRRIQCP